LTWGFFDPKGKQNSKFAILGGNFPDPEVAAPSQTNKKLPNPTQVNFFDLDTSLKSTNKLIYM